jgi:hypothetical protein
MQTGRLLLRYSDGTNEWRAPPTVPDLGAIIRRAGHEWVVASIETDNEDVIVAVLRRAPKAADLTDAQVEVA